ncbi:uncharacterized protein LOC125679681 [Ostrea edulis]|uniref:uncharacterized protein LOC125679681 n=1 Tax=Ostrea edulis TaxID=37623 RepID=UPI0024AF21E5|nr:uncharacterized protein LOC125679681 [Ostrea edulis]
MGDRIALSSTVKIKYKHTSKVVPIIVNRLYSFSKHCTWNEVLNDLTADGDHNIDKLDEVTVTVSDKLANGVTFEPDFEEQIQVVHNFDKKLKYVQFDVIRDLEPNNNVPKGQNLPTCPTAFDVLMRKSSTLTKLPQKIDEASPRFTAKQKLYNGIVNMFVEFEDKFPVVMTDKAISDQVIMPLTNAVWYLSGNMGTILVSSQE